MVVLRVTTYFKIGGVATLYAAELSEVSFARKGWPAEILGEEGREEEESREPPMDPIWSQIGAECVSPGAGGEVAEARGGKRQ